MTVTMVEEGAGGEGVALRRPVHFSAVLIADDSTADAAHNRADGRAFAGAAGKRADDQTRYRADTRR